MHRRSRVTDMRMTAPVSAATLDRYVQGTGLRFDAACWFVTARAPSA
jgi:hypothetical protein